MSKKHEETDDTVNKLKRIYKEIVGYNVSNHIGGRELEEVIFSDLQLTEDQAEEFVEHVNEEFDVNLTASDLADAETVGDTIRFHRTTNWANPGIRPSGGRAQEFGLRRPGALPTAGVDRLYRHFGHAADVLSRRYLDLLRAGNDLGSQRVLVGR